MSATYTWTSRQGDSYPHDQLLMPGAVRVVKNIFDGPAAKVKKGSSLVANDIIELISVPANTFVLNVIAKVTTVEGGTCTFHVGDGATADGYLASVNGNTTAHSASFNATTTQTFGVGKYYTAADTIDVKLITGTADVVVAEIVAIMVTTNV